MPAYDYAPPDFADDKEQNYTTPAFTTSEVTTSLFTGPYVGDLEWQPNLDISNVPNVPFNTPLSPEATLPPSFNTPNYGNISNETLAVTNIPPSLSSVIAPATFSQIPTPSTQIAVEQQPLWGDGHFAPDNPIIYSQPILVNQAGSLMENAQLKEDPVIPNIFPKLGEPQYSPEASKLFKASDIADKVEDKVRLGLSATLLDINDRIPVNASPEYIRTLQAKVAERLQPLLEGYDQIIANYAGKEGVGGETNKLLTELQYFIEYLNRQSAQPQAKEPSVAQIKFILGDLSQRFKDFPPPQQDPSFAPQPP